MADEEAGSSQPTTSDPKDLLPMIRQLENSGDDAVSPKGAVGRYQITPDTAHTYGLDPNRLKDPAYNEHAATTILSDLHRRYGGNTNDILTAYNAGPHAADRWIAGGRKLSQLPSETQGYLNRASSMIQAPEKKPVLADPEAPPEPAQAAAPFDAPKPSKLANFMADARANGYSMDEINQKLGAFRDDAVKQGHSPAEVNNFLGVETPPQTDPRMVDQLAGYIPHPIKDAVRSAWQDLRDDAIKSWDATKPAPDAGFWDGMKQDFDGFMATGRTAVDAFKLAMAVPSAALGMVTTDPLAAGLSFAMKKLDYTGMSDEEIDAQARTDATEMMMAIGPKGGLGKAISIPKQTEVIDAAVSIATAKSKEGVAHAMETEANNLAKNYVDTGERPGDAARRAESDPEFRTQMQLPPEPSHLPEGSSITPSELEFTGVEKTPAEKAMEESQGAAESMVRAKAEEINQSTEFNFTRNYEENHPAHEGDLIIPRMPIAEQEVLAPEEPPAGGEPPKGPPEPPAGNAYRRMIEGPEPGKMAYANPWEVVGQQLAEDNQTWLGRITKSVGNFYRQLWAPDDPLNQLTNRVLNGGPLPDEANGAMLNRMTSTSRNRAFMKIRDELLPVAKSVKAVESGSRTFDRYAYSKWAVEKAAQSKETGVEIDAAKQIVAEVEHPQHGIPEFVKGFQDVMDFRNSTLAYARDHGLISSDAYDRIVAENKAGIPGYRWKEPDEEVQRPGGAGKTVGTPVKTFYGSDSKVRPLWQSLASDAVRRIAMADQNAANLAIRHMAEGLGEAVSKVMKKPETLDPATWHDIDQEEYVEDMGNPTKEGTQSDRSQLAGWMTKFGLAKDEVPMFDRGSPVRVKFSDPHLTEYLRGYDASGQVSQLGKWARAFTRGVRATITNNPIFATANILYDLPFQFIKTPGYRNTLADFYTGVVQGFGHEGWSRWYQAGGGEGMFHTMASDPEIMNLLKTGTQDPTLFNGVWNMIKSPFRLMKVVSQDMMSIQKAGRFYRGIAQGETELRASVASTEAAFHRAGFGGAATRAINSYVPFTGAVLNSMEQVVRGQLGLGRTILGDQRSGVNFGIKAAAAITVPTLGLWALYKDTEWYKAQPDYMKDNGIFLAVGGTIDKPAYIHYLKFPPMLSTIYGAAPRRLAEKFINDNPAAGKDFAASLAEGVLPPATMGMASAAEPIVEHLANYSFFKGQPLVPHSLQDNTLPQYQYTKASTQTARQLSVWANDIPLLKNMRLSPPVIDNYIQQWGGIGNTALHATEMALSNAGVIRKNAPTMDFDQLPGFSRFTARYTGANAAPIRDFYDATDRFNQIHGSIKKAMADGDFDGFKQLLAQNPTAALMHKMSLKGEIGQQMENRGDMDKYMNELDRAGGKADEQAAETLMTAQKLLKQFNDRVKLIDAMPVEQMSKDDKRQQQDMIYGQMQVVSERALQWMDRAGMR
jgi:hypothetical protein